MGLCLGAKLMNIPHDLKCSEICRCGSVELWRSRYFKKTWNAEALAKMWWTKPMRNNCWCTESTSSWYYTVTIPWIAVIPPCQVCLFSPDSVHEICRTLPGWFMFSLSNINAHDIEVEGRNFHLMAPCWRESTPKKWANEVKVNHKCIYNIIYNICIYLIFTYRHIYLKFTLWILISKPANQKKSQRSCGDQCNGPLQWRWRPWHDPGRDTQQQCFKWKLNLWLWSNYSDLTRPHPKWWFSKGNSLISGFSRLVNYYNLARWLLWLLYAEIVFCKKTCSLWREYSFFSVIFFFLPIYIHELQNPRLNRYRYTS